MRVVLSEQERCCGIKSCAGDRSCIEQLEQHMDNVMKRDSQHVVAARAYLSQIWFKKQQRQTKEAWLTPHAKAQLAEVPPDARDVLRQAFGLYSDQGGCPSSLHCLSHCCGHPGQHQDAWP